MTILLTWKYDALHPQANWCYLMVNGCWRKCWLRNNKDTILALSQVNRSQTPVYDQKCTALGMCVPIAICTHLHACTLLAGGVWIRSGGLLSIRMYHEGSGPHPPLAFTSGLLKMISAHGGQALAFAFYWKHRDLEQRIYQLWADRIS